DDKVRRGNPAGGITVLPLAMLRVLPAVAPAVSQRRGQMPAAANVLIVAIPLAGQKCVQRMMEVVAPLSVETVAAPLAGPEIAGGKVGTAGPEVVTLGPKVVVDDIQRHRQAMGMCRVDQSLQGCRATICVLRSEREDAVVAPIARSGKLRHRH